ncbi:MAG: DUF72 domain-containing protein [Vicinamibacteria bacterium]
MVLVGTSGYSYPEWKGSFYPEGLAAAKMLPYYAERFSTVEINATFYRMPTPATVAGWQAQVPSTFRFTLKAPRRITHDRRLKDVGDPVRAFCAAAGELGPQLAALLFQTPPNLRCDLEVFDRFLETLPPRVTAAFEFRHDSWHDEAVFERLRSRNLALCIADSETRSTPVVRTADYAYLRLRDEGYQDDDLVRWAGVVRQLAAETREVFVYFKHEDEGKGPEFAERLISLLG